MYVDQFDFVEFYDKKYRNVSKTKAEFNANTPQGIGAVGILTQNQCVFRINFIDYDFTSDSYLYGVGTHLDNESDIYKSIYSILPSDFHIMKDSTYSFLDQKTINSIIIGNIRIRMANTINSNYFILEIPFDYNLTSKQIQMLYNVSSQIEEASTHLDRPITVLTMIHTDEYKEENSLRNIIIPRLKECVDDTYKPYISDDVIIAKKIKQLHL